MICAFCRTLRERAGLLRERAGLLRVIRLAYRLPFFCGWFFAFFCGFFRFSVVGFLRRGSDFKATPAPAPESPISRAKNKGVGKRLPKRRQRDAYASRGAAGEGGEQPVKAVRHVVSRASKLGWAGVTTVPRCWGFVRYYPKWKRYLGTNRSLYVRRIRVQQR